jgi:hypothetical protein
MYVIASDAAGSGAPVAKNVGYTAGCGGAGGG